MTYVQRTNEVVGLDAAEVVPALVVATAQQAVVVHTAAVVDVRQIVVDGADVREVDVLLHDAFSAAHQRRPVLATRNCNARSDDKEIGLR